MGSNPTACINEDSVDRREIIPTAIKIITCIMTFKLRMMTTAIAQLAERTAFNRMVEGSSPSGGDKFSSYNSVG